MPNSFFCYQPPENCPPVSPAPVLKNGYVTFASFNNLAKIGEEVVKLWSDVLKAVPDSQLLIQCLSLNDPSTREHFEQLFASHEIETNRIDFSAAKDFDSYLSGHADVDIVLDTFPWNGHTVSCHALWMGVPVITLAGNRHSSRMGASILTNLNLNACIASSKPEFITAAATLSQDTQQLESLRQELRPRMQASKLCDSQEFTQQLEQQYRRMWKEWCTNNH